MARGWSITNIADVDNVQGLFGLLCRHLFCEIAARLILASLHGVLLHRALGLVMLPQLSRLNPSESLELQTGVYRHRRRCAVKISLHSLETASNGC